MPLLDLFFPVRCVSCGLPGKYICSGCFKKIEFIKQPVCPVCMKPSFDGTTHVNCSTPFSIDGVYILAHYKGPVRRAIKAFKYRLVRDISSFLSDCLVKHFGRFLSQYDILVPVPLHKSREKERGFNQSRLLAENISQNLNMKLKTNILKRVKNTRPQAELKSRIRRVNVSSAFVFQGDRKDIEGKQIGLIDDVATTFSTLKECAKVLKRNRAGKVWGIVLAHG